MNIKKEGMRTTFFVSSDINRHYYTKPTGENENTNINILELLDGFAVETIASFFICIISIVHWCNSDEIPQNDWTVEFLPAFGCTIILLCIRDCDQWFPDGSWIITLSQFALGIYKDWQTPAARILGQLTGVAIAIGIMRIPDFKVADLNHHTTILTNEAVFSLNLISALVENISIIYIVLPLIPALHSQQQINKQHKLKETDKQNQRIALAAIILGSLKWCVWKIFNTETNPSVAFILYLQRALQKGNIGDSTVWHEYYSVIGAQAVATILCIIYAWIFIKQHRIQTTGVVY